MHVFEKFLFFLQFDHLKDSPFNAHTSNNPDFLTNENLEHADFLPDDYVIDTFCTPRFSQDIGRLNNHGRLLLDLCLHTGSFV